MKSIRQAYLAPFCHCSPSREQELTKMTRRAKSPLRTSNFYKESGLSLVELLMVILLIGIMSGLASTQIDSILVWRQKQEIRQLAQTWNFLFHHSVAKGQAFRLVIDLDRDTYHVLREINQPSALQVQEVDFLSNLRTQGEQRRRAEEQTELLEAEGEQALNESLRGASLEELFSSMLYSDPHSSVQLTRPEELKSLAERHQLPEGLDITSVKLADQEPSEGQTFIRLSPRGSSQFAIIRLKALEEVDFSIFLNPSTGEIEIEEGFLDYEWTFQNQS